MKYFAYLLMLSIYYYPVFSQNTSIETEGSITIGNDTSPTVAPGTIRFNGSDFQGWDGNKWVSLSIGNVVENSTDGSGGSYPSLQIGSQVWMARNLNTKKLNDGTDIDVETDGATWGSLTTTTMSYYQNGEAENGPVYGALYNWWAVETGKLCPSGWRVPTLDDWNILFNYLGTPIAAGGSMREAGLVHWKSPNVGATNSSEFTALPAGFRHDIGSFHSLTEWTYWWSSAMDSTNTNNAWYQTTGYGGAGINTTSRPKVWGLSVRCVRE
ncbi:MAG: hypothetical protein HKN76_20045 [Saprospiraceae bacterium]|nr:hypothetical protein [Saprospiraceae bacterium]